MRINLQGIAKLAALEVMRVQIQDKATELLPEITEAIERVVDNSKRRWRGEAECTEFSPARYNGSVVDYTQVLKIVIEHYRANSLKLYVIKAARSYFQSLQEARRFVDAVWEFGMSAKDKQSAPNV